jgi:hypothetical protein
MMPKKTGGVHTQTALDAKRITKGDWWREDKFQNQLTAVIAYQPTAGPYADKMGQTVEILERDDMKPGKTASIEGNARDMVFSLALEHYRKNGIPAGDGLQVMVEHFCASIGLGGPPLIKAVEYCKRLKKRLPQNPEWILDLVAEYKQYRAMSAFETALQRELANSAIGGAEIAWKNISKHFDKANDLFVSNERNALIDAPQWPHRIPWESPAWFGLAGNIVKAIDPLVEADPVAVLMHLLTGYGVMVGHRPHILVGASQHYANIDVLVAGPSYRGRKGTAHECAKKALKLADRRFVDDPQHWSGGLASGQGIIKHVRDDVMGVDKDGNPKVLQPGVEDKRWLIIEEEFGRTLAACRIDGSILSHIIRMAFDHGNLSNVTTDDNRNLTATGAHIGLIGHSTEEEFHDLLRNTTLRFNGFCNRFFYCCSLKSKELPGVALNRIPGTDDELDKDGNIAKKGFATQLRENLRWARKIKHVVLSAKAQKYWKDTVYPDLCRVHGNLLDEVASRGTAIVMRIALIQALFNRSNKDSEHFTAVILECHLKAAHALWHYNIDSVRYLFRAYGTTLDPDALLIWDALKKKDGKATRAQLALEIFGNHNARPRLDNVAKILLSKAIIRIQREKTGGRSAETWSLTDYDANTAKKEDAKTKKKEPGA